MSADLLERAAGVASNVLANVKPEQMDDPTPCASWKVRDLVNHIVGGTHFFASAAEQGKPDTDPNAADFSSTDFAATYAEGSKRAVAAFRQEGVMDKMLELPFGTMPGSAFVLIATTDTFTHAWDLAKATGQSTDLDPELAEELLAIARGFISDNFRGDEPMPFSRAVEVPETAPKADQLAGFLGRTP